MQFVEKDPKLAEDILRGLLKYWPVTSSHKEVLFLNELEEILEMTQIDEFQNVQIPLFKRLSKCISSVHFQVVESCCESDPVDLKNRVVRGYSERKRNASACAGCGAIFIFVEE